MQIISKKINYFGRLGQSEFYVRKGFYKFYNFFSWKEYQDHSKLRNHQLHR